MKQTTHFGRAAASARKSQQLSIRDLAAKAGVGRSTIGNIETGEKVAAGPTAAKLVSALSLPPCWLGTAAFEYGVAQAARASGEDRETVYHRMIVLAVAGPTEVASRGSTLSDDLSDAGREATS